MSEAHFGRPEVNFARPEAHFERSGSHFDAQRAIVTMPKVLSGLKRSSCGQAHSKSRPRLTTKWLSRATMGSGARCTTLPMVALDNHLVVNRGRDFEWAWPHELRLSPLNTLGIVTMARWASK
jgi:hypothetical protein